MKKKCSGCKVEKELKFFNKNKAKKDGLGTFCKECNKYKSKKYYEQNIDHHRKVIRKRKTRIKTENRKKILEILKSSKCIDCKNSDFRVLEFDHITGKKINNVGTMLSSGWSWRMVILEIAKCEIVCANCHRIRTFSRNPNYRTQVPVA